MKGWRERLIKHRKDKQKEREKEREGEISEGARWVQTREAAAQLAKLFILFSVFFGTFFVQCDIYKKENSGLMQRRQGLILWFPV